MAETIRAQAKKAKVEKKVRKDAPVPMDGREKMDREVVKAVLASPLITPWPNIPNHLQKSVLAALPKLATPDVSEYHVSRARCHQTVKKHNKRLLKKAIADGDGEGMEVDSAVEKITTRELLEKPNPPTILQHLVLGINETIKQLERNIDDLKIRLMMIADALNSTHTLPIPPNGLLPTAPRSLSPEVQESAPLGWIIVPLLSVSPQSLVSPIPQYCATYNSLVYQWGQLRKTVKTRLKEEKWGVLGPEREEIRVVPLGDVELEMARIVGLRRLASIGIRTSHPEVKVLQDLLPKSILHPPRHNITLPFPTSNLKVHAASTNAEERPTKKPRTTLPIPHVHYAPLTVKGITTTVPVDGNAKKQQRLAEVKKKRIETKEKKREARHKEFIKGVKGEKGKVLRHGVKKGKPALGS